MSGTMVGRVDMQTSSTVEGTVANAHQAHFVSLYNFMQQHVTAGNAALHASFYGNGAATGFDYHDGANPAGENAWAVFRFLASASSLRTQDFYVLIQWADTEQFGTSGGGPATLTNLTNIDGVGIMAAWRDDGGDPWNGTTNANGADTKGTPVWVDGGSTLRIPQLRNSPGGTRETNREDLTDVGYEGGSFNYFHHLVGDADGFVSVIDPANTGNYTHWTHCGLYTPRAGVTAEMPFAILQNTTMPPTAGTSFGDASGMFGRLQSEGCRIPAIGYGVSGLHSTTTQPNNVPATASFDEMPIHVLSNSAPGGMAGWLRTELLTYVYNAVTEDSNAAFTKAYFGVTSSAAYKFVLAWSGAAAPRATSTREGTTF